MGEPSATGGVKPMSIAGRMAREKERLHGMTPEERAWRKKWLSDQVLSPKEPRLIPTNTPEMMNPIRRMYRFPLDFFFYTALKPVMRRELADVLRFYTGRGLMGLWGVFAAFYYFKYNTNNWTSKSRWRVTGSKPAVFPGHPDYGKPIVDKKPSDYNDRGFKESVLGQMVRRKYGEF